MGFAVMPAKKIWRVVDEEQDVDPFERDGVDGEEVTGDSGLGVQEL